LELTGIRCVGEPLKRSVGWLLEFYDETHASLRLLPHFVLVSFVNLCCAHLQPIVLIKEGDPQQFIISGKRALGRKGKVITYKNNP
jgi:hypothetical protein